MSPSLPSAIRTAIRTGSVWEKINPFLWCFTYRCSNEELWELWDAEAIRWKAELTKETNARESGGEGK